MAEIKNNSVFGFIEQLKSKIPSPGGGSAAAIVLSLSLALYKKCLNFSSGNFSGPELKRAQILIEGYLEDSLKLADKDRDVYLALRDLLKNKNCSSSELTDAYKEAGLVPVEIVDICIATADLIAESSVKIKKALMPDLKTALYFLKASLGSAFILAKANLDFVKPEGAAIIGKLKDKVSYFERKTESLCQEFGNG